MSASEPSAFDAGKMDIENPYGLTESEKATLENRKTIQQLNKRVESLEIKLNSLSRRFEDQSEKIKGLVSVVEGVNSSNHKKLTSTKQRLEQLAKENSRLQSQLTKVSKEQNSTVANVKKALGEMGEIINQINKSYVDKKRFRKLENAFFELEEAVTKGAAAKGFSDDNWEVYKNMQDAFSKQEYDEVEKRAKYLIKQNFKRATSNYYLGEVNYYSKNYEDAIYYFKESWSLYDKSDFMPVLLLHTAISLEKTGKASEAKTFFENVIAKYPDSKSAKLAQQHLKGQ